MNIISLVYFISKFFKIVKNNFLRKINETPFVCICKQIARHRNV